MLIQEIKYICKDCIVYPTCTKLCYKFIDEASSFLIDIEKNQLPDLFKKLRKEERCLLCGNAKCESSITTTHSHNKGSHINAWLYCIFCETVYNIEFYKVEPFLADIYWDFDGGSNGNMLGVNFKKSLEIIDNWKIDELITSNLLKEKINGNK